MAQITAKDVTNLYLYGSTSTPANLVDNNLIRPDTVTSSVDVQDFMATGAGRFAIGSQFNIIKKFFDPGFFTPLLPAGIYTKQQLGNIFDESFYGWNMQQYDFQDNTDDYAERVYIYNSQAFQISDDARFILTPSGETRIENFAIEPIPGVPENFDFDTNDPITKIANSYLEARIDPSLIGRKVDINFINPDLVPRVTYDETSFANDVIKRDSFGGFDSLKLINDVNQLTDELFNSGVTKFLDGNKPILYGIPGDDFLLTAAQLNDIILYPTLYPYKDNGVVLIGGTGDDNIIGSSKDDKLLGGSGADRLRSNDGSDTLEGGEGNDSLDGGLGDDIFIGGAGDDMMIGGSFLFGLFEGTDTSVYQGSFTNYDIEFLTDGSVRIGDNVGNDGFDTLEGIDIARFSDKSVNLAPGQDIAFVIDTTGSMYDDMDAVKASSTDIINAIFDSSSGFLNSRIAVVGYNDPDTNTFLSFTDHPKIDDRKTAAINAIESISVGGGGDFPEAVNAGLLRALTGGAGQWRKEATSRRIILFGDAPPNDDYLRSIVLDFASNIGVSIPNYAMPMSIVGDIETSTVASGLAVTRFAVTTVDADDAPVTFPVEIFTVLIGNDPTTDVDFKSLADATGGKAFYATDASEVVKALIAAIQTPTDESSNEAPIAQNDTATTRQETAVN